MKGMAKNTLAFGKDITSCRRQRKKIRKGKNITEEPEKAIVECLYVKRKDGGKGLCLLQMQRTQS